MSDFIESFSHWVVPIALSVVLSVGLIRYVPGLTPSKGVVVLDAVRLNNAFRAAAAPLIGKAQEGREITAVDLSVTGQRTLEAIQKVSGGQLVLIKQATVGDTQMRDITSDVMAELGLREGSATLLEDPDSAIAKLNQYTQSGTPKETGKWQDKVLP